MTSAARPTMHLAITKKIESGSGRLILLTIAQGFFLLPNASGDRAGTPGWIKVGFDSLRDSNTPLAISVRSGKSNELRQLANEYYSSCQIGPRIANQCAANIRPSILRT